MVEGIAEEYVIATDKLTKKFGTFTAVDQLSLQIKKGEIFGFLGPNGAGKSTAIRMLCGILEPTSGRATVLGYDLQRETEKIKAQIGYMSQKFSLYDDLTAKENLRFYAGLYSISKRESPARIEEMIAMAGLKGRENELVANLSGGFRQRLALGCALIAKPPLLFLDEPTSGVSPTSRRMFFQIIRSLVSEGTTVLVTTHFMDEAERCHRIAFMSRGRLMAVDSPDNLKKKVIEGIMVELALPDGIRRTKEVEALPYVKECTIHGSLLHALLRDERGIKHLQETFACEVKRITPSLEDVFLALAQRQRAAEAELPQDIFRG
ncbi:MAG TPA: ABC transporter ATP-binding protein [Peptococcaceae bacterium]|nr:ABC transporter ATP-binding protein [Peptococcaceae bacterium]